MKRILLIMAIAFISVIAKAQDITISGITLGATKNEVIKILNEKKYQYQFEDNIFLVSPYTNNLSKAIKGMYIGCNSDNIVNRIMLITNADIKIFDDFDKIVSKLKEKYGEPFAEEEKYYYPYSENYRDYPLSAIEYVKDHMKLWRVNNLELVTFINKVGIVVSYSDKRYPREETTTDY
jgi:hypothetical protein